MDGHTLVFDLAKVIRRFVLMPDEDAFVVALWILHSYVFDIFMCTPRLGITSPEKRCGKTTLLDVIACQVNRPLPTADITGPAIFRTVEKARPTVLIDEADNMFGRSGKAADSASDILAILNSGHRHGGQVIRTVGEDFEPRAFRTHTPVVFALIGKLPGPWLIAAFTSAYAANTPAIAWSNSVSIARKICSASHGKLDVGATTTAAFWWRVIRRCPRGYSIGQPTTGDLCSRSPTRPAGRPRLGPRHLGPQPTARMMHSVCCCSPTSGRCSMN